MSGVLDGVRVVEVSQLIAAPLCGLTLADYGATVFKVETPRGDYTRALEPLLPSGESAYFRMLNRGKRLVRLNLRDTVDREELQALIAGADVVVESVGAATEQLGITPEEAQRTNPKLIWCSITGTGRGAGGRAVDPSLQASMGMMALTGAPDGPPMRLPVPLVDFTTGLYAVQSVLAAVLAVRAGEPGAILDCALLDAAATLASSAGVYAMHGDPPLRRRGTENMWYVPAATFRARDGEFVQVMAINERHWAALAQAVGHPEWLEDARFAGNASRVAHRDEVHGMIADAIETEAAAHWEHAIGNAGGFCARIREIEEAWADPALERRGLVTQLEDGVRVPTVSLARGANK